MKSFNRIIIWILVVLTFVQTPYIYAQESASASVTPAITNAPQSTPSATPSPFFDQQEAPVSATPSAIVDIPASSPSSSMITPTPTLEMLTGPSGVLSPSASMKGPPHIRPMTKHTFRAGEVASVVVDAIDISTIKTTVQDSNGTAIDSTPSVETYDGGVRVSVIPKTSMKPGKYTIVVEDTSTGTTVTQDFLWGVLAFNTDQATYVPGDTAAIALAVLDDKGMIVCNADVTLTILSPSRVTTTLTTADGTIRVTQACFLHDFTLKPDYETTFQTSDEGVYTVVLTATTKNGTYNIQDSFQVSSDMPFQVKRSSATRIYLPKPYPMTIDVTANEDFSGTVTETVPENFTITPLAGVLPYADVATTVPVTEPQTPILLGMPFEGNYPVTLGFGDRIKDPQVKSLYEQNGLKGHDGADFAMPIGTQVLAADSGTVSRIADNPYGTTVVIDHSWGRSYYGHLSVVQVKVGDTVEKGAPIALSGNTGLTTGAHLHFGMKLTKNDMNNGYYGKIDPMPYLTSSVTYQSENTGKQISWNVDIKSGEKIQLGYSYKAPAVSPQFYLVGPLTFRASNTVIPASTITPDNPFVLGIATTSATPSEASGSATATPSASIAASSSTNSIVYQEPRRWQIAADAITITYKASGTFTAGTGSITPPYPTGGNAPVANDIALLVVTSENQAISLTTANGFVELGAQANKAAGTGGSNPASRLAVYWKRCVGSDSAPVVADSGDNTEAQIHLFSGVITSGNPWDVYAEGNDSAANDTSGVIPGTTTTVNDTLIVLINSSSYNGSSTTQFSAWTNSNLANITERTDNTDTSGLGGGHGMATAELATAGNYGNTTVTLANTSYKGAMSIALKAGPGIHGSLGKSSDGWGGAIPVYGTLTGGLVHGDYPYARAQVVTPGSETYYTTMTWDSGDSRYEGMIYVGSWYCNACADNHTGTFTVTVQLDNNAGFPSIDYSDSAGTFTTSVTRRRSSTGTAIEYAKYAAVWSTDHWNVQAYDFDLYTDSGTITNAVIGMAFHPTTATISITQVRFNNGTWMTSQSAPDGTGNGWWWDSTTHSLYVRIASLTTTATNLDFEFTSSTDLWATRFDNVQTTDMGERDFWNGLYINNRYYTTSIYGSSLNVAFSGTDHDNDGVQAESRSHRDGTLENVTTDCMERVAMHVGPDGGGTPSVARQDNSADYSYDVKWKANNFASYIQSENDNQIVTYETSDDQGSCTGGNIQAWAQYCDNQIAAARTQTFYAGEPYLKNYYVFTNNDSASHYYDMVWGREQWLNDSAASTNDRGMTYQSNPKTVEWSGTDDETPTQPTSDHPWFAAYDTGVNLMDGVCYQSSDIATNNYFLSYAPLQSGSTAAEWPIDHSQTGTDAADTFFHKSFGVVGAGSSVNYTFWQFNYYGSSFADLKSTIDNDCTTLNTPSGPTTGQQMRHGNWFNASGVEQSFTF